VPHRVDSSVLFVISPTGHFTLQEHTMADSVTSSTNTNTTSGLTSDSQSTIAQMQAISADSRAFNLETMKIESADKKNQNMMKAAKAAYDGMTA
jgi:hypothetical protein